MKYFISSLLENQYETLEKHRCGNLSTPICDVTMVVPYSSNVCENSLVQWNVWIHRLPRENVSTMSPALMGRNFSRVDILLTFTLCQCNVITLLDNLSGTGARITIIPYTRASIHYADGRLSARSREVSKSRDLGLNFSNRFEIWLAPRQHRCWDACQISERLIVITPNLTASRLREIWR